MDQPIAFVYNLYKFATKMAHRIPVLPAPSRRRMPPPTGGTAELASSSQNEISTPFSPPPKVLLKLDNPIASQCVFRIRSTLEELGKPTSVLLLFALTLQIKSGKCCALGEFLIKLWSMCITSTTLPVHA